MHVDQYTHMGSHKMGLDMCRKMIYLPRPNLDPCPWSRVTRPRRLKSLPSAWDPDRSPKQGYTIQRPSLANGLSVSYS